MSSNNYCGELRMDYVKYLQLFGNLYNELVSKNIYIYFLIHIYISVYISLSLSMYYITFLSLVNFSEIINILYEVVTKDRNNSDMSKLLTECLLKQDKIVSCTQYRLAALIIAYMHSVSLSIA